MMREEGREEERRGVMFYGMTLDEEQAALVAAGKDEGVRIVFCDAAAGSGKTTLAMGVADMLVSYRPDLYDGIVYIVSPYGEGKQGYLPGSITEKSEVYFEPAYQAMMECDMNPERDVCAESMAKKKRGDGYVTLLTHTYLRGTNMQRKVVIIDEAQNFTVGELKKVLTRIHDSCKVLVVGHTGQVDIGGRSGFAQYIEHFRGEDKCRVCRLSRNYRGWISSWADKLEV